MAPNVLNDLIAHWQAERLTDETFKQFLVRNNFARVKLAACTTQDDGKAIVMSSEGPSLVPSLAPAPSNIFAMVLLIDFPDRPATLADVHRSQRYVQLLFGNQTGSMRDYYHEVSRDNVDVDGNVYGWIRMPRNYAEYTNGESGLNPASYPNNAQGMAEDAVRAALRAGIPFPANLALPQAAGPKTVAALFIIHAGTGAERQPTAATQNAEIWSHKWRLRTSIEVNQQENLWVTTYLTIPGDCKLGVCAHELGHLAFGWDDFYDSNFAEDGIAWDGSGIWDLMAGGSYNGGESYPAHPAAKHKLQHRWIHPRVIRKTSMRVKITPVQKGGDVIKVISPAYSPGQYLLLENRTLAGYDRKLPLGGLLVWRVNEGGRQTTPADPVLYLIQADGKRDLDRVGDYNQGDTGDPFPGATNRRLLRDRGTINTSFPRSPRSGVHLMNITKHDDESITVDIYIKATVGNPGLNGA